MRWDDWMFIAMFMVVVPGLISMLVRWILKDTVWAKFEDVPSDLQAGADWRSVFSLRVSDFGMKGFVRIAMHDGRLLVKPGLIWRLLGFKCKALEIAGGRGVCEANGAVAVLVHGKKYRLEIAPEAVLSDVLRSVSEQTRCP